MSDQVLTEQTEVQDQIVNPAEAKEKKEKTPRKSRLVEGETLPRVIKEKSNEHFSLQIAKESDGADGVQFRLTLKQAGAEDFQVNELHPTRAAALTVFRAIRKQLNEAVKGLKAANIVPPEKKERKSKKAKDEAQVITE